MATLTPAEQIQQIDVKAFFEQYVTIHGDPDYDRREGCMQYHCNCPFPKCAGSTDRFTFWENGRWSCSLRSSGCKEHDSSPIWFLVKFKGISYAQACQELGLEVSYRWKFDESMLKLPSLDNPPCLEWQLTGKDFVRRAQRYLWTKGGAAALAYLRSRGLTDETIKRAGFGYCPLIDDHWYECPLSDWGLEEGMVSPRIWKRGTLRIPPGIIIPWFFEEDLWKICVKRFDIPKEQKPYGQIAGSAYGMYNIGSVKPGSKVMIVEAEIDAWSAIQEAEDLVTVVATGGAGKGFYDQWIDHLMMAEVVLQSFDANDKSGAGDEGAKNWLKALPKSMRWQPLAHDVNDMLTVGHDIRAWVEEGLSVASQGRIKVPVSLDDHLADLLSEECACGAPVEHYDLDVDPNVDPIIGYCAECWANRTKTPLESFAEFLSKVVDMFGGCTIQKLPIGTTLQSYLEQQYPGRMIRDLEPEKTKSTRTMRLLDCVR